MQDVLGDIVTFINCRIPSTNHINRYRILRANRRQPSTLTETRYVLLCKQVELLQQRQRRKKFNSNQSERLRREPNKRDQENHHNRDHDRWMTQRQPATNHYQKIFNDAECDIRNRLRTMIRE